MQQNRRCRPSLPSGVLAVCLLCTGMIGTRVHDRATNGVEHMQYAQRGETGLRQCGSRAIDDRLLAIGAPLVAGVARRRSSLQPATAPIGDQAAFT